MDDSILIFPALRFEFSAPALIADAGPDATERFFEFFTANIRNANTRRAYARAAGRFFLWCHENGLGLHQIKPIIVAAYIEQHGGAKPSVKQSLAAIRMLFDWLVIGQVIPMNPASSVRGPKHVVKTGKTPALSADQARQLLNSIPDNCIAGIRDRAVIAVMCFTFARIGAVISMRVEDYFQNGKRWWVRLHEKGGKRHEVPAHHNLESYLDIYMNAAGIADQTKEPLFRTIDKTRALTERPMTENDALRMVKRRARGAGLPSSTCCHTFRATGIAGEVGCTLYFERFFKDGFSAWPAVYRTRSGVPGKIVATIFAHAPALGLLVAAAHLAFRFAGIEFQLIAHADASIVVVDMKGDNFFFWSTLIEAKRAGLPFRWFSLEPGTASMAFNPFTQRHNQKRGINARAQSLLVSLGLYYGDAYGESFYQSISLDTLTAFLAKFRDIGKLASLMGQGRLFDEISRTFRVDLTEEEREQFTVPASERAPAVARTAPAVFIPSAPRPWGMQ